MNLKNLQEYVASFLIFLEIEKNSSDHTIRAYRADLGQLIAFWKRIAEQEKGVPHSFDTILQRFIVALFYKKLQKSSLSRKLSCLRSLQNYLAREGITIKINAKSPRVEKKLPKILTVDEIFYLLDTVKNEELPTSFPHREKAIFELIYATGVRCSELVNIKLQDIDFNEKSIRIYGKGRKERMVLFGDKAKNSVYKYLERERPRMDPHRRTDFLFLNFMGYRITTRTVQRIFEMFRKFLKVDRELTPHKLRHSFATHMLSQGVDLRIIQELLGHKTLNTTEIYTKVTSQELAEMCDTKHPLNALDDIILNKD